jgi:hypothetical protein
MQAILKLVCWLTLFVDAVLVICSALTGWFGNGYPYAQIHIGAFRVTSLMPGGAVFITFIAAWTGILAFAVLYWMKKKKRGDPVAS